MIVAFEGYFGYVGDELGDSLVIGEGMSVAGGLVLFIGMFD